MPDGEYGYPKISIDEYVKMLEVLLRRAKEAGQLEAFARAWLPTAGFAGAKIPSSMLNDVPTILRWVEDRARLEGVHPALPFYEEVTKAMMPAFLGEQYEKRLEDWQKEVQQLTEEDWRNRLAYEQLRLGQEWQQREYEMAQQKFAWQKEQATMDWWQRRQEQQYGRWAASQNLQEAQANLMTQRLQNVLMGQEQDVGRNRTALGQAWEAWRNRLTQVAPNWVAEEEYRGMENPYLASRGAGEQIESLKGQIANLEEAKKTTDKMIKEAARDPEKYLTVADMQYIKGIETALDTARKQELYWQTSEEYAQEQGWAQPRPASFGEPGTMEIGAPELPETERWRGARVPEELSEYIGLPAKYPLWKKTQISYMPWEKWEKMPSKTRGLLAGYMDWTGQSFEDYATEMQRRYGAEEEYKASMLPRQPSVGYQWRPRQQWA